MNSPQYAASARANRTPPQVDMRHRRCPRGPSTLCTRAFDPIDRRRMVSIASRSMRAIGNSHSQRRLQERRIRSVRLDQHSHSMIEPIRSDPSVHILSLRTTVTTATSHAHSHIASGAPIDRPGTRPLVPRCRRSFPHGLGRICSSAAASLLSPQSRES